MLVRTHNVICLMIVIRYLILISLDIDECATNKHNCDSLLFRRCNNTERSFDCVCQDGYLQDPSGSCEGKNCI